MLDIFQGSKISKKLVADNQKEKPINPTES